MKAFTVRLPDELAAQIEAEARERKVSKSDIIRARLTCARPLRQPIDPLISDLVGSLELPADLSSRKKAYLKTMGYGQKHRTIARRLV